MSAKFATIRLLYREYANQGYDNPTIGLSNHLCPTFSTRSAKAYKLKVLSLFFSWMMIAPLISALSPVIMNGKHWWISSFLNFQLYLESSSESEMNLVFLLITSSLVDWRSMIRYPSHEETAKVFYVLESFCLLRNLNDLIMLAALNLGAVLY